MQEGVRTDRRRSSTSKKVKQTATVHEAYPIPYHDSDLFLCILSRPHTVTHGLVSTYSKAGSTEGFQKVSELEGESALCTNFFPSRQQNMKMTL